jgi:endonuclease III
MMPTFTNKLKSVERIRQHLRRRHGEAPKVTVTHPVEHAIRAILAEEATAAEVDAALDRLRRHFVDMNDLRVSRPREIRDVLGPNFPRSSHKARVIPRLLDQVFHQHNSMVWDFLESMGKVQARAYFEKLEDVRPFVAAVLARDVAGAHAVPVDNDVARVLGRLGILDPTSMSEVEMQAFLERAVKANRAYEFHWLVKRLSEEFCLAGDALCVKCTLKTVCVAAVTMTKRKAADKEPKKVSAGKGAEAAKAAPAGKGAEVAKAAPAGKGAEAVKTPAGKGAEAKKAPAGKGETKPLPVAEKRVVPVKADTKATPSADKKAAKVEAKAAPAGNKKVVKVAAEPKRPPADKPKSKKPPARK